MCSPPPVSANSGAIYADLLGKPGDAFLGSTAEHALQEHVLRDLKTAGSEYSIIHLSERLRRVANCRTCAGEFCIHDVSIYPYLACVKEDVAMRVLAQENTVLLLASSLPGCSQRA